MKKNLLFACLCTLYLSQTNAQTFQRSYGSTGSDNATDIAATKDGGFITVGDTYSFGLAKSDMLFVKTDASGNIQWTKTLGNTDYDHANAVIQTNDGGYAIAGTSGGNNNRMALVRLDANGNTKWVRYFSANTRQGGNALVQTPDGGFALAGSVSTYNNGSWGYLVKTDSTGGLMWSKLVFSRDFYPELQDITLTSDGGFAVVGNNSPDGAYYDMYLIKLKSNGAFEWARSIGGTSTETPTFVKQTSDNGYLFGGYAFSFGPTLGQDMFVAKTDASGTLEWARNIGTASSESCTDAFEIPGGYVVVGSTDSSSTFTRRPMLVRFSGKGKYLGSKIMNEPDDATITSATPYSNTGFAIAGAYSSSFGGNQEVFVAKFNKLGNTCGTYASFGIVKDTGVLVTVTIPVTNANTTVAAGGEVTVSRTFSTTDLCALKPASTVATSVDVKKAAADHRLQIRITPNPVVTTAQLKWNAEQQAQTHIQVFSLQGMQVYNTTVNAIKGENSFLLPVSNLASGMYLVKLRSGTTEQSLQFMKQ